MNQFSVEMQVTMALFFQATLTHTKKIRSSNLDCWRQHLNIEMENVPLLQSQDYNWDNIVYTCKKMIVIHEFLFD